MSGSSLQERFLIDSRRFQAFRGSWEKKGSSVRKEVWFVYGENSPVTFHIVSCSEEQPKAFTLSRRRRFCAVATAIVQQHHLQGVGAYLEMGCSLLGSPCSIRKTFMFYNLMLVGFLKIFLLPRICSSLRLQHCLNGGALPKVSSVKYSVLP